MHAVRRSSLFEIRPMFRRDLATVVGWAAAEGWNPGLHDAATFRVADPGGFLLGLLGEEPIAAISAVRYGASFGFLGLYLVRPDYRGHGYGIRVWEAAMTWLAGRRVGLDGVVDQQANYARSGFQLAHRNVRYEGVAPPGGRDAAPIVPLSTLPVAEVLAFDAPFFPDDRARFLEAWITQPGAHALGWAENGRLLGYGVLRPCQRGHKIGPLFADDSVIADELFRALAARATPDAPIFLDVPEVNGSAVALAERHGMTAVFETARMYAGGTPRLPLDRVYGVTSFELG